MAPKLDQIITEFNSGKQGAALATDHLRDLYLSEDSQSFGRDIKAINERVNLKQLGFSNSSEILGVSVHDFLGVTWGTRLQTASADRSQMQELDPGNGLAVDSQRSMTPEERTRDQAIINQTSQDKINKLTPGNHHLTMMVDGVAREYDVHVPLSYNPAKPMPMVVMLDGVRIHMADPDGNIERTSGLDNVADEKGFIAVYPKPLVYDKSTHLTNPLIGDLAMTFFKAPGTDENTPQDFLEKGGSAISSAAKGSYDWLTGTTEPAKQPYMEDVDFVKQTIGAVEGLAVVDKNAVYMTGFSMGGELASEMAAIMPHTFAGVGSIHGTKLGFEAPLPQDDQTAFFMLHSKNDKVLPLDGGGIVSFLLENPGNSQPLAQFSEWAQANGATGQPSITGGADQVISYAPDQTRNRRGVEEVIRENGMHAFDGPSEDPGMPLIGVPDRSFPAAETMMNYLLQFKRTDQ